MQTSPAAARRAGETLNWPTAVFARGYAYHCQSKVLPTVARVRGFEWILDLGSWILCSLVLGGFLWWSVCMGARDGGFRRR
jgi:hypothetical protein